MPFISLVVCAVPPALSSVRNLPPIRVEEAWPAIVEHANNSPQVTDH